MGPLVGGARRGGLRALGTTAPHTGEEGGGVRRERAAWPPWLGPAAAGDDFRTLRSADSPTRGKAGAPAKRTAGPNAGRAGGGNAAGRMGLCLHGIAESTRMPAGSPAVGSGRGSTSLARRLLANQGMACSRAATCHNVPAQLGRSGDNLKSRWPDPPEIPANGATEVCGVGWAGAIPWQESAMVSGWRLAQKLSRRAVYWLPAGVQGY